MRINKAVVFVMFVLCTKGARMRISKTINGSESEEPMKSIKTDNGSLLYKHIKTTPILNGTVVYRDTNFFLDILLSNSVEPLQFVICGSTVQRGRFRNKGRGRIGFSKDGHLLPVIQSPILHNSTKYCRQGVEYENDHSVIMLDLSCTSLKMMPHFSSNLYNTIRYLDLSNNAIMHLNISEFSLFKQLTSLDISSNLIHELVFDQAYLDLYLMTFDDIFMLNVSNQRNLTISCPPVSHEFRDYNKLFYVDSLGNINPELTASCKETLTYFVDMVIHVDGEPLPCNCTMAIDWVSGKNFTDPKSCECSRRVSDTNRQSSSERITHEYIVILCIVSFISGFLVFAFCGWYYVKRRGKCYSYCTKFLLSGENKSQMETRRAGVYLVSAEEDLAIMEHFAFELEKCSVQTIFERRDLAHEGGQNIISLIHRSIDESNRTLFLMSSNFLQDKECLYILHQAKGLELSQNRFVIIMINLENAMISANKISDIYVQNIVFNYPVPPSEENTFWTKLVECIEDANVHVHISK